MKSRFLTIAVQICITLIPLNLKAQTNIPANWIEAINRQSLEKFNDSINIYFDSIRPVDAEYSKQEKYYKRWLQTAISRSNYIGAKDGGDLKWKNSVAQGSFTCNKQGPSGAIWENIGMNPKPGDPQRLGLIRCVEPAANSFTVLYAGTDHGGLWKTIDGGQSWFNLTDDLNIPGLGIYSITVNPNNPDHLIVATTFGEGGHHYITPVRMFTSTNGGQSFNTVNFIDPGGSPMNFTNNPPEQNDDYNISNETFFYDVKFHPNQPNVAYAVGIHSIYKTVDGGLNWSHVHNVGYSGQGKLYLSDIEFSLADPNVFYVSSSWNPDYLAGGIDKVNPPATNVTSSRVYGTIDAGNTWSDITPSQAICFDGVEAMTVANTIAIDVRGIEPGWLYASFPIYGDSSFVNCNNSANYILRSTDYGQTWTQVISTLAPTGWIPGKNVFEASNSNSGDFYLGCIRFFKVSIGSNVLTPSDSGSMHVDHRDMFQLPAIGGEDRFIVANDGGVSTSENSSEFWENRNGDGLLITQCVGLGVPEKDNQLFIGAIHNGLFRTSQDTNIFHDLTDGEWVTAPKSYEKIYWLSWATLRKLRSYNWPVTQSTPVDLHNPPRLSLKHYINPSNEREIWYNRKFLHPDFPTSSHFNEIQKWNVDSVGIEVIESLPFTVMDDGDERVLGPVSALAISESNPNVIFYATENPAWGNTDLVYKLRRSTDGGATFQDLSQNFVFVGGNNDGENIFRYFYIVDLIIDPEDENRIWVVLSGYNEDYKIVYSPDMGQTWDWSTYSAGLPPYVAHNMAYYKGSDDLMFLGTDAGVFYWNKNNLSWECYNNSLPDAIVRKVEIHYCTNSIYAGTHGRGVWKAPIVFDDSTILDITKKEITTSTVWSNDKFVPRDIVVKSGNTLTFTPNTRILMGNDKKIIVEPGAELNVNGATITNGCLTPWRGIEVLGASNMPQTTAYQGKISTANNTTIENAFSAISTIGRNGSQVDWNSTGAILDLDDTYFRNNWRSIEFMSYHNYNSGGGEDFNISSISKCTFDWDSSFLVNSFSVPKMHVSLWDVRGVQFRGNTFNNNYPNDEPDLLRLQGIYSLGAWYKVQSEYDGLSNPPIKNVFNGLNVACHMGSAVGYDRVDVSEADFNNNHVGVYVEGASYSEVNTSTFNVPKADGFSEASQGIRIDRGSGHLIHENTFNHDTIYDGLGNVGVYVFAGDAIGTTNEIFKNDFNDLTAGLQFSDTGFVPNNEMIIYNCDNFFNSGQYDAKYASVFLAAGELGDQGSCPTTLEPSTDKMMFNTYSGIYDGVLTFETLVDTAYAEDFDYNSTNYSQVGIHPMYWLKPTPPNECSNAPATAINHCDTSYLELITDPINNPIPTWLSQVEVIEDIEENLSSGLIDQSEEDNLISIIQGSGNDHSKEQELLDKSPYLTSPVLSELAKSDIANFRKNNVFSLHYPVDQQVMYDMVTSPNTITPYILRDALVAGAPVDNKTALSFFQNESIPNWAINDVGVANSPLPDDELVAILSRSNVLEPYRIWNILQLNTPLSDEVEIALMSLDPPTAQWVLNKINTATYVAPDPSTRRRILKSQLEQVQADLKVNRRERFAIANKIVRRYLDSNEVDSTILFLESQNSINASCALVPILAAEKQTKLNTHIQLIKDYVSTLGEDEQDKANNLLKFCDYFEFVAPIQIRQGGFLNLTPDEIQTFEEYANANLPVSGMAKSILNFNGIKTSHHYVEPLPGGESLGKKSIAVEEEKEKQVEDILLYPNPNNGSFILEGSLKDNQSSGNLVITDIAGKVVYKNSINGNTFRKAIFLDSSTGIYLYYIEANNEIIHRGKIAVK